MKRTVWLLIGLILGAGGVWVYMTRVYKPLIIADTIQSVKESIEMDRIAEENINRITGTVVSVDDETFTFAINAQSEGTAQNVTVTTDNKTLFNRLVVDSNNPIEPIGASLINAGASVVIITNAAITGTTIYATEITLL